jgi:hypothetical protein
MIGNDSTIQDHGSRVSGRTGTHIEQNVQMSSMKRAMGIGSDGLTPGEAFLQPAGEVGEGEAD